MRRICLFVLFIVASFAPIVSYGQDTVSTDGIVFTPVAPTKAPGSTIRQQDNSKSDANSANNIAGASKKQSHQSLWAIFLAGILGGFAALLMPCIFPMLPFTMSYFTKQSHSKSRAVRMAICYGLSIIAIYVILGLTITVIFGADTLNNLATNGVFNMLFFVLLVAFAASFLGAFEITLPNSWVNKMDENADKGGVLGIFFMATTLSLVSFSCTGPIIGTLLVQAAVSGALLGPAVGMLGFSLALALPFTLFALFPSLLKSLPQSGGWLNSIKVVLGFLELALSLKFLSNVDLAYHWHLFDREVFLVLWIVIFTLMGFYLLGKLRFAHDSTLSYITVPRLFLAIGVLSFSVYMVPGLWGAPLKSISAFLPPKATQDFDLSISIGNTAMVINNARPEKYVNLFDKPKGFNPFFDYDEGLAYARKIKKPVMIDFTGHACVNCRKMEENIWPDKQVSEAINEGYVLIQLYVDDKTDLPAGEQFVTPEGRKIKTIGNKWSYLQTSRFLANSQPFYVLVNSQTEQPIVAPKGADYDAMSFYKYLKSGLNAFRP
ncbi:protein-disulfide reductase DsbD [Mucilaginibacter sp. SG564]|uniref:protein-disulfide reductase DsbD family protein n=1 Tax=Mucilaginibacter sp. SG564 TaxID=2587022 RepID=UPI001553F8A3|nr:cytochrome c biogenesis protein CcdA [Mucilaginibacter sp. SG564]NOW95035.1 thiol:disulfide interchange protein DsbD [Mucilaginibacter sp. SG564]